MSRFGWPEPETLVPMCGRFASGRDPDDLAVLFGSIRSGEAVSPSWNIAPTDPVQIVLERADRTAPRAAPVRQLRPARWGLVPFWSTDSRGAARRINARGGDGRGAAGVPPGLPRPALPAPGLSGTRDRRPQGRQLTPQRGWRPVADGLSAPGRQER